MTLAADDAASEDATSELGAVLAELLSLPPHAVRVPSANTSAKETAVNLFIIFFLLYFSAWIYIISNVSIWY